MIFAGNSSLLLKVLVERFCLQEQGNLTLDSRKLKFIYLSLNKWQNQMPREIALLLSCFE